MRLLNLRPTFPSSLQLFPYFHSSPTLRFSSSSHPSNLSLLSYSPNYYSFLLLLPLHSSYLKIPPFLHLFSSLYTSPTFSPSFLSINFFSIITLYLTPSLLLFSNQHQFQSSILPLSYSSYPSFSSPYHPYFILFLTLH